MLVSSMIVSMRLEEKKNNSLFSGWFFSSRLNFLSLIVQLREYGIIDFKDLLIW